MKDQLEQEISLTESPYFITEVNRGEFYIVNSIVLEGERNWTGRGNKDSKLEEGLDIREFANRDISILVETKGNPVLAIIDKLRDFAYLGSYDYVSYRGPLVRVCPNNYKVNPRIFRKIVND